MESRTVQPVVPTHPAQATDCVNCGADTSGRFCHQCGQPMQLRRITMRSIAAETAEKIFGFDNMFTRTLWHSFTKPGVVAMTYIRGNRRKYIGPVAYFLLISTLYLLFVNASGFDMDRYVASYSEQLSLPSQTEADLETSRRINEFIMRYTRAVYAINALFFAIPLWLFFRKKGRINFMEAVSASVYYSAITIALGLLSLIVYSIGGKGMATYLTILSILLSGWLTATMFTKRPSWINFIKGILASVVSVFIAGVLGIITVVVLVLWLGEDFIRTIGLEHLLEQSP